MATTIEEVIPTEEECELYFNECNSGISDYKIMESAAGFYIGKELVEDD